MKKHETYALVIVTFIVVSGLVIFNNGLQTEKIKAGVFEVSNLVIPPS